MASNTRCKTGAKTVGNGRFQAGKSGNPSGRPKRSLEERTQRKLEKLASSIPARLENMLADEELSATTELKIYELLLDRTFGGKKCSRFEPNADMEPVDTLEDIRREMALFQTVWRNAQEKEEP